MAYHLQKQRRNYSSLNEIRKANLAKLASKVLKPSNFSLKSGMIVTDSNSKKEKIKINGSRALSPSSLKLFKVIKPQHDGMSALCRNLKDGKVSTQSINNLRTIDVNDLLTLQINPEFAFKELMDMTRLRNLHGKFLTVRDDGKLDSNSRLTRSGNSDYSQNPLNQLSQPPKVKKGVLKVTNSRTANE